MLHEESFISPIYHFTVIFPTEHLHKIKSLKAFKAQKPCSWIKDTWMEHKFFQTNKQTIEEI
jgi:hypothetical protein